MPKTPCKHLDYDKAYTDCTIRTCAPHFPEVRYWVRGPIWTEGLGNKGNPRNVQFCNQRGRINNIFDCYEPPGPMHCYDPKGD